MTLADVRDYIASLDLADHVYMAKLPDKQDHSIGVYHSKHQYPYKVAIGGPELESYGVKHVTLLIHWSKSPRETEAAATAVFNAIQAASEVQINESTIKFFQPLYDLQDIGTDEAGSEEMVREMAVIYEKEKAE